MTSSPAPPDLSSLSLNGGQAQHDTNDFAQGGHQQSYFNQQHYATMGASPLRNNRPARSGLPASWSDTPGAEGRISPQASDPSSLSSSPPPQAFPAHMVNTPMISTPPIGGLDDDVIPTAIVIKNIPFNVKRETLMDIIQSLAIPTPYAFNYHLDTSGQFRGLAFANFRAPSDADAVVAALNGFDVQGRKLRVEYKKVLQAGEKERIEREKALRRMRSMQLEKEKQNVMASHQQYDEFGQPIAAVPPAFTPSRSFSGHSPWQTPGTPYSPGQMPPLPHMASYGSVASLNASGSLGTPGGLTPGGYTPGGLSPGGLPTPGGGFGPVPPVATPGGSLLANSLKASTELDMNDAATLEIYSRILVFKEDVMRDELAFSRTLTAKQRRVVHLLAQKLGVYHYSVGEGDDRYAVVTRINPESQQAPPRLSRAPSAYQLSANAAQQSPTANLRTKKSMPDMAALRQQVPRLSTRPSNTNIREGFATIASPARRAPSGGLSSLFGGAGTPPPMPTMPPGASTPVSESPTAIVRQPRGPAAVGFSSRRDKAADNGKPLGLDARSHEPLEI